MGQSKTAVWEVGTWAWKEALAVFGGAAPPGSLGRRCAGDVLQKKKPHALFKGLWMMPGRAVPAPWCPGMVLARGRWRWQHGGAAPARVLREHVPGGLGELSALLPALLVSGEKALFSSCHSATFQRLSLRLLPPPRSQMCAVRGPENSPYPGKELQHPPKLPAPTPRGC